MKNTAGIAGLSALALLIVLAAGARWDLRNTRAASVALGRQHEALRRENALLEARLRTAQESRARVESPGLNRGPEPDPRQRAAKNTVARAGLTAQSPVPAHPPSPITILIGDPRRWAEYKGNYRAGVSLEYGPVFAWLGLTPAQRESFAEIETDLREMIVDLEAAAELHRLTPAEWEKMWSTYQEARVARKTVVLGDLTRKYLKYYRAEDVRRLPRELAYAGIYSGESIKAALVEQVADILVASAGKYKDRPAFADPGRINWPTASRQLQGLLSPGQVEILGVLVEKEIANTRLRERRQVLSEEFLARWPAK